MARTAAAPTGGGSSGAHRARPTRSAVVWARTCPRCRDPLRGGEVPAHGLSGSRRRHDVPGGADAAAHGPLHGRGPPGGGPRAGQRDARQRGRGARAARGLTGGRAKVAWGSLTTALSRIRAARARGSSTTSSRHGLGQLGARHLDLVARARDRDRQVVLGAVAAAHRRAVEDPLDRAVDDRGEGLVHHRPVVPDVHVHDRRGAEAGVPRQGGRGRRRRPAAAAGRAPPRRPRARCRRAGSRPRGRPAATASPATTRPAAGGEEPARGRIDQPRQPDARPADRRPVGALQEPALEDERRQGRRDALAAVVAGRQDDQVPEARAPPPAAGRGRRASRRR